MRKYFRGLKIKTRIIIIYITVLVLSFLLTFGMIYVINQRYMEKEIGDAGVQTVNALAGNLSFIFENVSQFSDLIYFDDNVQESLDRVETQNIDAGIQRTITKSLVNMILSGDYISSVFIFDKFDNNYFSYKVGPILIDTSKIRDTEWYRQMKEANGSGFFIHRSEGVINYATRPDKNYISYIREIGNKDTYEPLAVLLLTIDAQTIQSYFEDVSKTYDSQFFIVDSEGEYIIPPTENEDEYQAYLRKSGGGNGYETVPFNGQKTIMASQELGIQDWKLVGSFQMNSAEALAPYYTTTVILIMCINIVFVFICSMLLTKMIFAPLSKIEKHMKVVEKGEFTQMQVQEGNDEINSLRKVFNHMIKSIQELINKVQEEKMIIAKGELDIVQAQINPHFLYNTLDAVSALALLKDHGNCFKMTQALGSFYRNSLNSGMDFISVRDEIQCIDSYITILNIRYDNKIQAEYDIEENILDYYVLKLLLQPLIENAVHHGIKGKDGWGTVSVKAYQDEDEIIFIVTDDGCGMDEERIREIMEGRTKTGKSGFGIYSLIQRIELYYHIDSPVTIHSELGSGTEITVRVKVRSGGEVN